MGLYASTMPLKAGGDEGQFPNYWHVGLCTTCVEVPVNWCLACVCAPCFSCHQRIRIYDGDMDRYLCCGGAYCGDCACGGKDCPHFCLCIEVFLCFWCSIFGNRWLIQTQYGIQNTPFETCIIWTMCIFSWVRLILSILGVDLGWLDYVCDAIYCMFSACMQSQQEAELDYQKGGPTSREMTDFH